MNSIRPLITITILIVVGAVLYVKINESTPRPAPSADDAWNNPVDVPPLTASSVAPTTGDGAAPPWSATTAAPLTDATPADGAAIDVATTANAAAQPATTAAATPETSAGAPTGTLPAVPAIPAIPEVNTTTQANASVTTASPSPTSLPANIPEARYPDQLPISAVPGAPANAAAGAAPAEDVTPIAGDAAANSSLAAQQAAATPEQMNTATAATAGIASTPAPLDSNPLRPTTETTPADRYGSNAASPTAAASGAPTTRAGQTFVQSWPTIQAALGRGELTEAHKLLSRWYGDPSLTPTDAERVETLLSQLAGTVVYSTEHRLAPAHVVKQGETLDSIAKEYNVPWQLLAKINQVAAADQVRPGQELKVVRGPFSAVVDLTRNQLTLMVDDRYAGRFPISVTPGQTVIDGEWVVGKKSNEQSPGRALLLQGSAAAPGATAPQLVIASDSLETTAADGTVIKVAAKDADELSDILSIGSRVVTRR